MTRSAVDWPPKKIERLISDWNDGVRSDMLALRFGMTPRAVGQLLCKLRKEGYNVRSGIKPKPMTVKEEELWG